MIFHKQKLLRTIARVALNPLFELFRRKGRPKWGGWPGTAAMYSSQVTVDLGGGGIDSRLL